MTNSTVGEVTKNIHDTLMMTSWRPMSKPTTWQFNLILCQVVMTKTLTGYDLKQCHICIQNVIIERNHLMTVVRKHA